MVVILIAPLSWPRRVIFVIVLPFPLSAPARTPLLLFPLFGGAVDSIGRARTLLLRMGVLIGILGVDVAGSAVDGCRLDSILRMAVVRKCRLSSSVVPVGRCTFVVATVKLQATFD